jgi:error-prone DNA polymerase
MGSRLVSIRGKLQKADNVIHVVAEHIENLTGHLTKLLQDTSSIPTLAHADEVRRPTWDHRQKPKPHTKNMIEMKEELRRKAEIVSNVMPGGRNFH